MMQVRHPQSLERVDGQCPHYVGIGGEDYDCADGQAFDVSEAQASALAARYDIAVASIAVADETAPDPADGAICGAEMGDGSTCERPADDCPYHG